MSFHVKVIGKARNVKAVILADTNIPQPVKDTVSIYADAAGDGAIEVEASGHYRAEDKWSNLNSLRIQSAILAPEVEPPPAAAPVAQAAPASA